MAAGKAGERERLRELARGFIERGERAQAIAVLEQALASAQDGDPADPAALTLLGRAHDLRGEYAQAADAYGQALAAEPGDPVLWRLTGIAQRRAGRPRDALASLERSLEAEPGQAFAPLSPGPRAQGPRSARGGTGRAAGRIGAAARGCLHPGRAGQSGSRRDANRGRRHARRAAHEQAVSQRAAAPLVRSRAGRPSRVADRRRRGAVRFRPGHRGCLRFPAAHAAPYPARGPVSSIFGTA